TTIGQLRGFNAEIVGEHLIAPRKFDISRHSVAGQGEETAEQQDRSFHQPDVMVYAGLSKLTLCCVIPLFVKFSPMFCQVGSASRITSRNNDFVAQENFRNAASRAIA